MPKKVGRKGSPIPKVLVFSEDIIICRGLVAVTREEFGCDAKVVESRSGLADDLQLCWGLAILVIPVHRMDFLRLMSGGRERSANVLVFGDFSEEDFAFRAMKSGALGYLNKSAEEETIRAAMRQVASGRRYLAPGLADRMADTLTGSLAESPIAALSDREFQIFHMLRAGETVAGIAVSLGLADKTVYSHRERLRKRLGVNSYGQIRNLETDLRS